MSTLAYRSDIDGLRAIAVLAVVLYHYGIGPIHGGFVGVDIFFVISGYLITGIIHKEIGEGRFTFAAFYERRIRRIFPALFMVLAATLAVGCWLLLPSDLLRLGNAALATLVFGSNVLFWRQSGYFDTSAEYNPLLHTWSLAVEEQFYIGLPILLILLQRFAKGQMRPVLIAGAVLSFALCVGMQSSRPAATFFLSPFRAWELLLGGWLAVGSVPLIRSSRIRVLVSVAALALLLWSLWWIKAGPAFPGWQAALPVIATAVLLHAGASGSSWVQRLLSLKPLVFVGLISYSLYLWHWPLFVMVRYRNGMEPLAPAVSFLLCGVAILLAAASYRWVETPLRRKTSRASGVSWRTVLATALSSTLALAIGAHIVKIDHGRQSRFSKEIIKFDNYRNPVIPFVECQGNVHFKRYDPCVVGDVNSDRRILLWGDSYAMAWVPAFDVLGKIHSFAVDTAILSSCPGLVGIDISGGHGCKSFNEKIVEYLSGLQGHSYEAIVLIGSWGPYLDSASGIFLDGQLDEQAKASVFSMGLRNSISIIAASGAKPIIIGPTPGAPGDVPYRIAAAMAFNFKLPQGKSIREVDAYDSRFWSIANKFKSMQALTLVDPSPWFIAGNEYLFKSEQDGLLYRDSGHLSLAGANFVARQFPVNIIPNAMSITTQHGPKP